MDDNKEGRSHFESSSGFWKKGISVGKKTSPIDRTTIPCGREAVPVGRRGNSRNR